MIIPSIDIMGGRVVQLRQGKELVLTAPDDPVALVKKFNRFGPVAVVDLDAALGQGNNRELIARLCRVAETRVGGGIRSADVADFYLRAGAKQIVIGTAAAPPFLAKLPRSKVIVALDHRGGFVVDQGWREETGDTVRMRMELLAPYAGEFLVTFVDTEGTMTGLPVTELTQWQKISSVPITAAGGVANTAEAVALMKLGVHVQVGMALYQGKLDLAEAVTQSLDFAKCELMPTVVQDEFGEVLMLAYSSRESLTRALNEGKGIYFSRSRNEIWVKGETSGHTQTLLSCRPDCDNDALLFVVRQKGEACHRETHSCFGTGKRRFSLGHLFSVVQNRLAERSPHSYAARLCNEPDGPGRKIGEEALELIRALDAFERENTVEARRNVAWESADLVFHAQVALARAGLNWEEVMAELYGRAKEE